MDLLQHPLMQSIAVPLALAFIAAGLLRARPGAGLALGLGAVVAASLLLSWRLPAAALVEKLPWCLAAAWALGVALDTLAPARKLQAAGAVALWLCMSWWLGGDDLPERLAAAMAGVGVLALLLAQDEPRASAAAVLVAAGLGLAATAFAAGSLLLMQLALLLAAATGGVALWLWPRARRHFGAGAAVTAGLAWLVIAQSTARLTPAPRGALLLLALGFVALPLAWRLRLGPRAGWAEPLAAAAIAAAVAAGAVAWTLQVPAGAASGDDPYYEPRWQ